MDVDRITTTPITTSTNITNAANTLKTRNNP